MSDKDLVTQKSYELMSNDRLADILRHKTLIVKWFEALESLALKRLLRGDNLPGLKLTEARTQRKWKLSEEEIKKELSLLGIVPTREKLKTIVDVERELGSSHKQLISKLIEKPRGALKVAVVEEVVPFDLLEE